MASKKIVNKKLNIKKALKKYKRKKHSMNKKVSVFGKKNNVFDDCAFLLKAYSSKQRIYFLNLTIKKITYKKEIFYHNYLKFLNIKNVTIVDKANLVIE